MKKIDLRAFNWKKASILQKTGLLTMVILFLLLVVWIFPFPAQNITLKFYSHYDKDQTSVVWSVKAADSYQGESTRKAYLNDGIFSFRLDPEFRKMDSISFSRKELAEAIYRIEIYSGAFSPQDVRIGVVERTGLCTAQDNKAVLTDSARKEIQKIISDSVHVDLQFCFLILLIYSLIIIFLVLDSYTSRFKAICTTAVCAGTILFLLSISLNHSAVDVRNGNSKEEVGYDITDGENVVDQKFTLISKRLYAVSILFRLDTDVDCGILMELIKEETGEIIQKRVISTDELVKNETTIYDFFLDQEVSDIGQDYRFRVTGFDNSGNGRICIASSSSNLDAYGTLLVNGEEKGGDMVFQAIYHRLPNLILARIVCIALALLLILCIFGADSETHKKQLCKLIYVAAFGYTLFQMLFYWHYVGKTPDESKHIAYVAYLEQENVLLPDFTKMHVINVFYNDQNTWLSRFSAGINYLRHPPLYYHILRLAQAVTFEPDGSIRVEAQRLRLFSMGIAVIAFLIIFYIGYTRIKKEPYLHLLYTAVSISVPMLNYCAAGISNDTLALLTVTLFFWGILRLAEHRLDWRTYWLIAVGMSASLLTKATAGLLTVLTGAIVLVIYMAKKKCYGELLKPAFLSTVPVYAIAGVYYISIYFQFGSFQPSLYDVMPVEMVRSTIFYTEFPLRSYMNPEKYLMYFMHQFMTTWTGIMGHIFLTKQPGAGVSVQNLGVGALWFLPILSLFSKKKEQYYYKTVIGSMCLGVFATLSSQLIHAYRGFTERGWEGSFQSRYYLCVICAMAFGCTFFAQNVDNAIDRKAGYGILLKRILLIVTLLFCALLFYEDFVFFLLNFTGYPIYYQ